jgi:hypothetical protein
MSRRETTLGTSLPELVLRAEVGGPPNGIAHCAANSPLLAHDSERPTTSGVAGTSLGVSEGTRTPDRLDHNQTDVVRLGCEAAF